MATPPPSLMEELVEEILLRLAPEVPASLVRAAVVCKPWRRLISSARFRRRFLELHRTPPLLGFICNYNHHRRSSLVLASSAASPLHGNASGWCALDARHGRVLLLRDDLTPRTLRQKLVVWDLITDEQRALPAVPWPTVSCTAAVLWAAAATAGAACDHRGCHRGPFKVAFVGTARKNMFVCTYSSDVARWSDLISIQHLNDRYYTIGSYSPNVLLGKDLYFGIPFTDTVLKYGLELCQEKWIQLPFLQHYDLKSSVPTATDDSELGLVRLRLSDGVLCIWSRMDTPETNGGWTQFKVIDLVRCPGFIPKASLVGSADGLGIVFVTVDGALQTVDLKTNMVKMIYYGREMDTVFPYMRFYSPALEAASSGEEPSAARSTYGAHVRGSWSRGHWVLVMVLVGWLLLHQ